MDGGKAQNTANLGEKIIIKELTPKDANDLIKAGFPFHKGVLIQKPIRGLLQATKLFSRSTKLVAYDVKEKLAIGFLCLEENTPSLNSIKFVFTNPRFRKRGVATGLINFALLLAKERGAKKVHLDVKYEAPQVIQLYEKIGFRMIGHTMMGQGYISRLRVKKKGQLISLSTRSKKTKDSLYSIYQLFMNKKWKEFFNINPDNFINGHIPDWQSFFFRDVFVNDQFNSFVLVFNRPFFSDATVEMYGDSKAIVTSMLDELMKILYKRGISYINIKVFNFNDKFSYWCKEKGLEIYQFVNMGKIL